MLVRTIEDLSDMLVRYNYTANLSRGNWAWEFARRNPALRDDAYAVLPQLETGTACHDIKLLKLHERDLAAEAWGLLYFPDPDQSALSTDVFWSDQTFPRKIAVHVRDRAPGETDEIFEKGTRLCKIVHLTDAAGREHFLVKGANCSVQIRCSGKSLLCGEPVKMEFSVSGFDCPDEYIGTLKRAHRVYDAEATSPTWSRKGLGYRNALIALDALEAGMHQADDTRSTPEFVAAHVRRLEALRRAGHVERTADAEWKIPPDYLESARAYERAQARFRAVQVLVRSELGLREQETALGVTWLDDVPAPSSVPLGFGREVAEAQVKRRAFLAGIGVKVEAGAGLSAVQKSELLKRDLAQAGRTLSGEIGKPYSPVPERGHLDGTYREPVSRVSGKFAVIERQRDFTIVPWRQVLEQRRGLAVSGVVRGGRISWTLGRGIGMMD